jgi:hypothetical protein
VNLRNGHVSVLLAPSAGLVDEGVEVLVGCVEDILGVVEHFFVGRFVLGRSILPLRHGFVVVGIGLSNSLFVEEMILHRAHLWRSC